MGRKLLRPLPSKTSGDQVVVKGEPFAEPPERQDQVNHQTNHQQSVDAPGFHEAFLSPLPLPKTVPTAIMLIYLDIIIPYCLNLVLKVNTFLRNLFRK
jgi:hypothetical protein